MSISKHIIEFGEQLAARRALKNCTGAIIAVPKECAEIFYDLFFDLVTQADKYSVYLTSPFSEKPQHGLFMLENDRKITRLGSWRAGVYDFDAPADQAVKHITPGKRLLGRAFGDEDGTIVIAGVLLSMVAVKAALELKVNLIYENLRKVSDEVTSWLSPLSGWIRADSNEAQKLFKIEAALYDDAPIGPDGKKPEELEVYHEAKAEGDTVKIDKNSVTEGRAIELKNQMIKENAGKTTPSKRGIFSPNKNAADSLFKKIIGMDPTYIDIISPHGAGPGYFYHYHPEGHNYHIWWP